MCKTPTNCDRVDVTEGRRAEQQRSEVRHRWCSKTSWVWKLCTGQRKTTTALKDLGVFGAFGVPGVHKNSWAVTQTHIPLIQTFQLWEENPAHLRVWPDQTVCEIQPLNNAGGLPVCVDCVFTHLPTRYKFLGKIQLKMKIWVLVSKCCGTYVYLNII